MISKHSDQDGLGGFAAVLNSRLATESRIATATSFAWRAGGAAIALSMSGLGVFLALYGYSFVYSVKPAAEQVANALVQALQRTPVQTRVHGTMALARNSTVEIAPGQTLKLDEGATVKLDPNSTVRVIGLDMPQPSSHQLGLDAKARDNELPFTSYTIFRSVSYASGEVVTGYHYDLANRIRPKFQNCYYTVKVEKGLAAKYAIAFNGKPEQSASRLGKAEFEGALANCTWFPD